MAKNFISDEDALSVLVGYANKIKTKQKKSLSKPIVIEGVRYETVETALRGIARAIGGDDVVIAIFVNTATGANVKAIDSNNVEYVGAETETAGEYRIVVPDYGKYLIIAEKNGDEDAVFLTAEKPSATIPQFDATLNITTDEDNTEVTVSIDDYIVKQFVINVNDEPTVFHVPMAGEYVVAGVSGEKNTSEIVSVVNNDNKNIEFYFNGTPLPTANIGDIIEIASHNCMCIGTNRYILMEKLGNANWNDAMSNAASWSDTDIEDIYNVSDKTLMSKTEAEGLTVEQRKSISSVVDVFWLSTEYNSSEAYFVNSDGNISHYYKNAGSACLPAFTLAMKKRRINT